MTERINERVPSLRYVFYILVVTFLISLLMAILWGDLNEKIRILILETSIIIPALVLVIVGKYSFQSTFRLYRVKFRLLVVSLCIGLGLGAVMDEIDRLIQTVIPMRSDILEALQSMLVFNSQKDLILLIMASVVIAAFAEEMLFRGLLQVRLERNFDLTKAVMTTALIFTFIHFNPWWAIEIMILGVVLGILAWRSNSIFPGIIMHGVNNGVALAMVNSDVESYSWYFSGTHVAPIWILLGLGLVVGGFRLFFCWTKQTTVLNI